MPKRIIAILAVLLLSIAVAPASAAAESGTCPVSPDEHETMRTIADEFAQRQILQFGRGPGITDEWLDLSATRAEFAVVLARALALKEGQARTTFPDLQGHWAAGYISALAREFIVKGHTDGTFAPDVSITLPELRLMLVRAFHDGSWNTAIPCAPDTEVTHGQMLILLSRALTRAEYLDHLREAMLLAARRMIDLGLIQVQDNW